MPPARNTEDSSDFFETPSESSAIKIEIVVRYFEQWSKIMTNYLKKINEQPRIAYIDLYAGPGRYGDGTRSTPIRILEVALKDSTLSQALVSVFNDQDKATAARLEKNINAVPGVRKLKHKPEVRCGTVNEETVAELKSMRLVPTLLFADPFGYSGLSLGLINSILRNFGADCVFFFNYNRINAAIDNDGVAHHIDGLFGKTWADTLRGRLPIDNPKHRERIVMRTLASALQKQHAQYVQTFRFQHATKNMTSHYLVFVTKHEKGYELMQRIMASMSSSMSQGVPTFEFVPNSSKKDPPNDVDNPMDQLIDELPQHFRGQVLTMKQVWLAHSPGKNYISQNYKIALGSLLEAKRIRVSRRPKKGSFADDIEVTFPINLRCPECSKSSIISEEHIASCWNCNEEIEDLARLVEENEYHAPDGYDYAIQADGSCCDDYVLELGEIDEGAYHPQIYVCCACGRFEISMSGFEDRDEDEPWTLLDE